MISLCIQIQDDEILNYIMKEIQKTTISKITYKKSKSNIYDELIILF